MRIIPISQTQNIVTRKIKVFNFSGNSNFNRYAEVLIPCQSLTLRHWSLICLIPPKKIEDSLLSHVEYNFKPKSLKQKISVLNRVKHNKYYRSKITRKTSCHQFAPKQQRKFFASLRWHIVPDDGNSDDEFIKIA